MTELTSRNAALWLQPDNCGGKIYPVECALPDDFTISTGDTTTVYCMNKRGEYEAVAKTQAPPEDIELTIQTSFDTGANWFDTVISEGICKFPIYLTLHCPKRGVFGGWQVTYRMENVAFQSQGVTGLGGDFRTENILGQTYTFKVAPTDVELIRQYELLNIPNTAYPYDLNAVDFCEYDSNCSGANCESDLLGCETIVMGGADNTTTGVFGVTLGTRCTVAEIVGTNAITATLTDSVASVQCSTVGGVNRQIYAVNTAAAAPEIYYADGDDNYVNVTIGVAVTTVAGPNALRVAPNGNIFLVLADGTIWMSEDNAETWEMVDDGTTAGAGLNCISFLDELTGLAGGVGGVIVFTKNGGESWTQSVQTTITDDIVSIEWNNNAWFALTASDGAYYTFLNDEDTILSASVPGLATHTGVDLKVNGCTVFVAYNKSSGDDPGRIAWSVNGMQTFEPEMVLKGNTGWNAIQLQGNGLYAVGDGGTIGKATNVLR